MEENNFLAEVIGLTGRVDNDARNRFLKRFIKLDIDSIINSSRKELFRISFLIVSFRVLRDFNALRNLRIDLE